MMSDYTQWFSQLAPHIYSVRQTVFCIRDNGEIFPYIGGTRATESTARLYVRKEPIESEADKQWYDQQVTWTVGVKRKDGSDIYLQSKTGTASPYDVTIQELFAYALDALREAMEGE